MDSRVDDFFSLVQKRIRFFLSAFIFTHYTRIPPPDRRECTYILTRRRVLSLANAHRVDSTAGLIRIRLAVFLYGSACENDAKRLFAGASKPRIFTVFNSP